MATMCMLYAFPTIHFPVTIHFPSGEKHTLDTNDE